MKQITIFLMAFFCSIGSYSQDCITAVNDSCIDFGAAFDAHNFVEAWALECGSDADKDGVAVIDIFSKNINQDLFGKIVGDSIVPINPLPEFLVCHHGVSVAGTIGAMPNNGMHVAGVGYNTKVGLYNVGIGNCGFVSNLKEAIDQAVADEFKIINVSAAGTGLSHADAVNLTNNGVVIVVAAGGNNHSGIFDVPGVINCGAVRWNQNLGWTYKNVDPTDTEEAGVDIFGFPIIMRLVGFDRCEESSGGTSIVAPMVSGVVALMRSANPDLTPAEIECIIRITGRSQVVDGPTDPIPMDANPRLLDAEAAVQMAIDYDPESFVGPNSYLDGTQTISNIASAGNIIIKTGADITFDGVVQLGHNSRIIVNRGARLHIDGATVGPMECTSSWDGFRVVGNSFRPQPDENATLEPTDSGVLIIDNNAQINNARKAVSMRNTQITWDNTSNYFGGLVIAEGVTFNFNHRSFEFMQYRLFQDNSRIVGCTFNHNTKYVMTLWRNDGVQIEGNAFNDYQQVAIYSENAAYDVINENTFNGINNTTGFHYGIQVNNTTMPDRIPTISNNIFNENAYGTLLEGLTSTDDFLSGIPITGNTFQNLWCGIRIQGTNDFNITNNNILADDPGIISFNSGDGENIIANNRMVDGIRGLAVVRNNDGLRFYENCFENLGVNLPGETYGGGIELFTDDNNLPTVHMLQSNGNENAADNCFENVEDDIYEGVGTDLPDDYFVYLVEPDYPLTDCRVPEAKSFIEVEDASSDGSEPCLNPPATPTSFTGGAFSRCTIPTSASGLENGITNLENEIIGLLPIDSSKVTDRKELYDLLACLKRLKMQLIRNFISHNKESNVEVRFGREEDPYIRTYAYSHLVNTAHYAEALSYLNGVQDTRRDWQNFRQAQLINLRRLQDYDTFSASPQEIDFLYAAGSTPTFYATWIRSIYTAISGKTIIFDLPHRGASPRGDADLATEDESSISIFPNPAKDDIQISGLSVDLQYKVRICDIKGKVILEDENISDSQKINISNMPNGVYIMQVYTSEKKMIHALKIIKMR